MYDGEGGKNARFQKPLDYMMGFFGVENYNLPKYNFDQRILYAVLFEYDSPYANASLALFASSLT